MQTKTHQIQRISAHLPKQLLYDAQLITNSGITDTLKSALETLIRIKAYENIRKLRGQIQFTIDLKELRKDK